MNYSIIRCICALVIGVLLVAWPEAAILYLVITIGVLFLVPGLFSLSGYLIRGKQDGSRFPIAGLGSLLFGLWLMIMPAFFVVSIRPRACFFPSFPSYLCGFIIILIHYVFSIRIF